MSIYEQKVFSIAEEDTLIQHYSPVSAPPEISRVPQKLKKIHLERRPLSEATSAMMKAVRRVPVQRLPEFFEQTCDRLPHEIAAIWGDTQLTYQELDQRSNRLAHFLISRGVGVGNTVGILLERSLDTYIALLGILKAGAAFVPLDPMFPPDVVAFIAADTGLQGLVTTSTFRQKANMLSCPVLELDQTYDVLSVQPDTRPQIVAGPASLCYIIYTFDMTGQPKGVAVSHANIVNTLREATPIYHMKRKDRVYQGMSIANDFSLQEIWPTWIVGATLVIGLADFQQGGQRFTEFLIEQKITVFYCTPDLLATIERDVPSVRSLILGGERCPTYLIDRWAHPGRRMLSTYGPPETALMATWSELFPGRPVTLGSPLSTYQVYILDDHLNLVEHGKSGEIYIGGPGVAMGYFNHPDLTMDRFLPNPIGRDRKIVPCLYRTGDRGRMTAAGEIEYLGRIASQVHSHTSLTTFPSVNPAHLNNYADELKVAAIGRTKLKHMSLNTIYKHVMTDPLYRNALFKMAGTFISGGLGFVFWIIVARIYSAEQVGIATSLISIMALLGGLAELGLGSNLMRHLPKSAHKNALVNSSFVIVMLVTLPASTLFLLGLPIFSPQMLFLRSSIFYIVTFIVFVVFSSWNILSENAFMAFRAADNILVKNTITSVLKIVLPFIFIVFGAYGIFASAALAITFGVLVSFVLLILNFKLRPSIMINFSLIKETSKYSFTNYITNFALNVPSFILPVIILNTLSAKYAAYYYIASTIQTNLQIIPSATTQALLTEGSYNETELEKHLKKAMISTFVILLPATAMIVLGGNIVLQFFGKGYATGAIQFLRLYSISTLFTAFIFICNAIMNVKHQIKLLVILNVSASVLTLGLSYAFIPDGLVGIGWGWTLGQVIAGLAALYFIMKKFATRSA